MAGLIAVPAFPRKSARRRISLLDHADMAAADMVPGPLHVAAVQTARTASKGHPPQRDPGLRV